MFPLHPGVHVALIRRSFSLLHRTFQSCRGTSRAAQKGAEVGAGVAATPPLRRYVSSRFLTYYHLKMLETSGLIFHRFALYK